MDVEEVEREDEPGGEKRFVALLDERDLESALALARDDGGVVFDDRRGMGVTMTASEHGEYLRATLEPDQVVPWNVNVVAIRSDRLALVHFKSDFVATVGGSDYLNVLEVADGRILSERCVRPRRLR